MKFKNNAELATFIRARHIAFSVADEKAMIQEGTIGIVKILESVRKYIHSELETESVEFNATLFYVNMLEPVKTKIKLIPIPGKRIKDGAWEYIERPVPTKTPYIFSTGELLQGTYQCYVDWFYTMDDAQNACKLEWSVKPYYKNIGLYEVD